MEYKSMKSNITLNDLIGKKQSSEIDKLLERYEENIDYMQWIKETIQKFQEDRMIMDTRPQPLEGYDHEKKKFIEQDFSKFVRRLYEMELDTICENEEILNKISTLNKSNEEETPIKTGEKSEDPDRDQSDDKVILVKNFVPYESNKKLWLPYECCKEMWCTCNNNSIDEESKDPNKDHTDNEFIVISPIPYECCQEIWCTCYSKLINEKDDSEYEEYWSKYYEQYVDKLVEDDQF